MSSLLHIRGIYTDQVNQYGKYSFLAIQVQKLFVLDTEYPMQSCFLCKPFAKGLMSKLVGEKKWRKNSNSSYVMWYNIYMLTQVS